MQPVSKLTLPGQSARLVAQFIIQNQNPTMMLRSSTATSILAALMFSLPLLAHADAAQEASVKELIAITHLDNMRASLAQQASTSALPLLREYMVKNKVVLSEAQQQKLQGKMKGYVEQQQKLANNYFNTAANKKQFESALIKAYSAKFSSDELKQILAFYKSPAGQKLMAQQSPILNGVGSDMLKSAEKGLLPQMRNAAASFGKSAAK